MPVCINEYDHNMGAVDIGDQYRASFAWSHRWRRGPWQPLGWGFLLGTVLVNSFLLASRSGVWNNTKDNHLDWRKTLVSQLFATYSPEANARRRARPGMFAGSLKADVPYEGHERGKRGVRAACRVCASLQNAAKRRALKMVSNGANAGDADYNAAMHVRKSMSRKVWGCITCNVAICKSPLCWDIFHHSRIGVR